MLSCRPATRARTAAPVALGVTAAPAPRALQTAEAGADGSPASAGAHVPPRRGRTRPREEDDDGAAAVLPTNQLNSRAVLPRRSPGQAAPRLPLLGTTPAAATPPTTRTADAIGLMASSAAVQDASVAVPTSAGSVPARQEHGRVCTRRSASAAHQQTGGTQLSSRRKRVLPLDSDSSQQSQRPAQRRRHTDARASPLRCSSRLTQRAAEQLSPDARLQRLPFDKG